MNRSSMIQVTLFSILAIFAMSASAFAQAGNIAVVYFVNERAGVDDLLNELKVEHDSYTEANVKNLWDKLGSYWLIWVGYLGVFNPGDDTIVKSFVKHESEFKAWIDAGGALVKTISMTDTNGFFALLPDSPEVTKEVKACKEVEFPDDSHPILNQPNDVTKEEIYANWPAWIATGAFTEWDGYDLIVACADGNALWLLHKDKRVCLNTINCTCAMCPHIEMTENILEYMKAWPFAVEPLGKLATTWGGTKSAQ